MILSVERKRGGGSSILDRSVPKPSTLFDSQESSFDKIIGMKVKSNLVYFQGVYESFSVLHYNNIQYFKLTDRCNCYFSEPKVQYENIASEIKSSGTRYTSRYI
jgi:hypothetical protein